MLPNLIRSLVSACFSKVIVLISTSNSSPVWAPSFKCNPTHLCAFDPTWLSASNSKQWCTTNFSYFTWDRVELDMGHQSWVSCEVRDITVWAQNCYWAAQTSSQPSDLTCWTALVNYCICFYYRKPLQWNSMPISWEEPTFNYHSHVHTHGTSIIQPTSCWP